MWPKNKIKMQDWNYSSEFKITFFFKLYNTLKKSINISCENWQLYFLYDWVSLHNAACSLRHYAIMLLEINYYIFEYPIHNVA